MHNVPRERQIIANNFRALRKAHNKTQKQLGELLGLNLQQIQKYEAAQNRISADTLWMVAQFYGIEVSYFFEGLKQDRRKKPSEFMRLARILENMPRTARATAINFMLSLSEPPLEKVSE